MQKLKVMFRKAKAKITGKVPCSFETIHGHDFELQKITSVRGVNVGWYKCKCGQQATMDRYTGLCAI